MPLRTFADWNEAIPGSMEMDLVAHCGEINRGSYINSLVLTDIASGWTEAAPLVVREGASLLKRSSASDVSTPVTPCVENEGAQTARLRRPSGQTVDGERWWGVRCP